MKLYSEIEATDRQLMAAAQFLKRLGFSDIEKLCSSKDEAYDAQYALEQIRKGLTEQGYNPR